MRLRFDDRCHGVAWGVCASLVSISACAPVPVALISNPPGALIELTSTGEVLSTPVAVELSFPEAVVVSAPGYRDMRVVLRRREAGARKVRDVEGISSIVRGCIDLVLVPVHGPSGTWKPTDIER